ncbi:MAG: DUF373 family protein [Candidatus Methanomethylophilaceae archaeon]
MKRTLVLVVDRDDDFGVKGKVNTPVIGVQNCIDAATAFGIADPEDSDLNALYAAISVCLEIQEDGHDADVALICGDEKVGHRSDLALVSQLEEVLDKVEPDSVVLVGDGAEDEYIYPIISSRAHVDSVKKVYVKQAPGLEGTVYILSRMMSDPGKRKRFLVPLGIILMLISLMFIIPGILVYMSEGDVSTIASMSGSLTVFLIGLLLVMYGYNFYDKLSSMKRYIVNSIVRSSTRLIFLCLGLAIIGVSAIWVYYEVGDMYMPSDIVTWVYWISAMIWPIIIGVVMYVIGNMIDGYQSTKTLKMSQMFGFIGLASIGLVALGILDLMQTYISASYESSMGVLEIIVGVVLSIFGNFAKGRLKEEKVVTADEVL